MRSPDRDFLAVRLCVFAFLINAKPSEPFLTLYLNQTKMLSEDQLSTQVFPYFRRPAAFSSCYRCFSSRRSLAAALSCCWVSYAARRPRCDLDLWPRPLRHGRHAAILQCGRFGNDAIYFALSTRLRHSRYARLTALVLAAYHVGNTCAALVARALVAGAAGQAGDLLPLFYCSWVTTTLALMAFWLLPPPRRAASLAGAPLDARRTQAHVCAAKGALRSGRVAPLAVLVCARFLGRSRRGLLPTSDVRRVRWRRRSSCRRLVVAGVGSVDAVDAVAPFGLLEAAIEAGLAMGAILAPACTTRFGGRRPAAFVAVTSVARAVTLGVAAMAAQQAARGGRGNAAVIAAILNVLAATLHGLQRAVASSLLAARASRRCAELFLCQRWRLRRWRRRKWPKWRRGRRPDGMRNGSNSKQRQRGRRGRAWGTRGASRSSLGPTRCSQTASRQRSVPVEPLRDGEQTVLLGCQRDARRLGACGPHHPPWTKRKA